MGVGSLLDIKKTHRVPHASVLTEQKLKLKRHLPLQFDSVVAHCSASGALGALRDVIPKLADGMRPVAEPLSRRQPPVTMLVEVVKNNNCFPGASRGNPTFFSRSCC